MRFEVPEGATPIDDASGFIPTGILTHADLCAVEAENILKAANKHLSRRKNPNRTWLIEAYIRQVHHDMFDEVWEWAGRYREAETNIGIQAYRIVEEIGKLCQDIQYWDKQKDNPLSVLERTVRIHHRLVWIHPFRNGNGRHARMIADIYLRSHNHPLPTWPSSVMSADGDVRSRYLTVLREADQGNLQPLLDYTTSYLPPT